MRNIRQLTRLLSYMTHRRINAFWLVALVFLTVPWMFKGCQVPPSLTTASIVHENCAVVSVYDGDSMTVNCSGERMKIRLYCIDAPEMDQKPWGQQSRDHLRAITPPVVRLVQHDRDRYGRIVAEVIVPDDSEEILNRAQVFAGHAAVYRQYCSDSSYTMAERVARDIPAGIWSVNGPQQRPWEWRKRK